MIPSRASRVGVAGPEHAPLLAEIERRAAHAPWSLPSIEETLRRPTNRGFLVGEPAVGHLLASCVAEEGEILTVAVLPEHRRQGHAGALLAAGQILPAAGKLLSSITSGNSQWDATEELSFGVAGFANADAGFRVIASANSGLEGMRFRSGSGLIDTDNRPYAGDQPYIVIAIDGAAQPELEDFTAMVTSSEVMKRFRLGETGQQPMIDDLVDLMTIISDVKFREEALELKGKMSDMSAPDKAKAKERFDALVKNIMKKELRP